MCVWRIKVEISLNIRSFEIISQKCSSIYRRVTLNKFLRLRSAAGFMFRFSSLVSRCFLDVLKQTASEEALRLAGLAIDAETFGKTNRIFSRERLLPNLMGAFSSLFICVEEVVVVEEQLGALFNKFCLFEPLNQLLSEVSGGVLGDTTTL